MARYRARFTDHRRKQADDAGKQTTTPGGVGDFGAEWSQALTWLAVHGRRAERLMLLPSIPF